MEKQGKLVRDKIPQIIRENGRKPIVKILSDIQFLEELDKKLNEEVTEYQIDKSLEEIADVLEVILSICEARGYSVDDLMRIRNDKKAQRGSFKEKIYLEDVIDE